MACAPTSTPATLAMSQPLAISTNAPAQAAAVKSSTEELSAAARRSRNRGSVRCAPATITRPLPRASLVPLEGISERESEGAWTRNDRLDAIAPEARIGDGVDAQRIGDVVEVRGSDTVAPCEGHA